MRIGVLGCGGIASTLSKTFQKMDGIRADWGLVYPKEKQTQIRS